MSDKKVCIVGILLMVLVVVSTGAYIVHIGHNSILEYYRILFVQVFSRFFLTN